MPCRGGPPGHWARVHPELQAWAGAYLSAPLALAASDSLQLDVAGGDERLQVLPVDPAHALQVVPLWQPRVFGVAAIKLGAEGFVQQHSSGKADGWAV